MSNIDDKFLKPYSAENTEGRIYELWEKSGFFNPDNLPGTREKPFTILMPPTNANGSLHAGHGLVMTIEDIMIRYKRMQGFNALWLPGLDHAGFETQVVYEKQLEKEDRSRFDMDAKTLYDEILDFTKHNSNTILSQIKSMGASCDWSRTKFTLDQEIVDTVYRTFRKLSDDDLVYRGKKIISWCPKHKTSFSDLEIKDEERIEPFYYLKYGPFTIATSRPETKFGDKYVVMHPEDERYSSYKHGEKIELEWIEGPITATIIKDEAVDREFGTGVMTITPWHDATDFEIATRHNLDKEQVIDEGGKLLEIAGEFAGTHIKKARPLIIEKLKNKGLVVKVDENYKHVVRTCYKCGTIIEPQIKNQWFIRTKPLAERVLRSIRAGEVQYIPDQYEKITTHWLNNIIDWNISRQIVWGIPIPAKLCIKCDKGIVDIDDKISSCPDCKGEMTKETDTFDTWFSSSQWPFAALGGTDSSDFGKFYPTDVMETAGEIIFFWVTRMLMLSLYVTDKLPFKTVYLHGLVLDAKGRKMSKSKGNVINPLDLTSRFGTDAFRMGIIVGNTPGTSLSLSDDKIKAYKHFANKVWNVARYVFSAPSDGEADNDQSGLEDDKYVSEFTEIKQAITSDMDTFRFYLAAEKIYHYVWHTFADIIIEKHKEKKVSSKVLKIIFVDCIKMLHPFMPFITEEIWQIMPTDIIIDRKDMLIVESWPHKS